jgi:hypothetical protein
MSSPAAPSAHRAAGAPRPSLSGTVLRLAAIALVAAVLIWSALFADVLRKHSGAGAALSQPAGQISSPDGGQAAQAPTPVTTRSS